MEFTDAAKGVISNGVIIYSINDCCYNGVCFKKSLHSHQNGLYKL